MRTRNRMSLPLLASVLLTASGAEAAGVVATGKAFPERSRPLWPFPEHAHYLGQGNPEVASSFDCRE
jgi:feruloyl esterase